MTSDHGEPYGASETYPLAEPGELEPTDQYVGEEAVDHADIGGLWLEEHLATEDDLAHAVVGGQPWPAIEGEAADTGPPDDLDYRPPRRGRRDA